MIKDDYLKEIKFSGIIQRGDHGPEVEKVQEWLCLNHLPISKNAVIAIDGQFGPITQNELKYFQEINQIPITGIVDQHTWNHLVNPMVEAFTFSDKNQSIRKTIIDVAYKHIESHPRELNHKNEGPWVRAYMGGHDGNPWAWCVGSALTILDQALSLYDKKFTDYYPDTYSCDVMGNHAKKKKALIRNKDLKLMDPAKVQKKVKPGDIVQISKTPTDWTHCALILEVHKSYFITAEGNTNDEGSREGYEFVQRKRNFRLQNLDVLTLKI